MKRIGLKITLLNDCVFSERNATDGGHSALDYIPGSALLGAVAARLYTTLGNDAFDVFHAGKVRFHNAYGITPNGFQTHPMPACWHRKKGENTSTDNYLNQERVWRLDLLKNNSLEGGEQAEQLRAGYVAQDGSWVRPNKSFRMKTAIDSATGRAKEAALFGYDAIRAGQHFAGTIDIDEDIDPAVITKITQVIQGDLLLGRSRSAEYGRARVSIINAATINPEKSEDGLLTLWLQSDLMTYDDFGQSTLRPLPEWLGLPKGRLLPERSFVRTRRYSPWNAFKRGYELERQVINKGSVLVFELANGATLDDKHLKLIASGLGVERQAGLGQVLLNPPLLMTPNPKFSSANLSAISVATSDVAQRPIGDEPELITWLRNSETGKEQARKQARKAREYAEHYRTLLTSARSLRGIGSEVAVGPSQSQWGILLKAAKSNTLDTIFLEETGSCKRDGDGWSDMFWDKDTSRRTCFYDWISGLHTQQNDNRFMQKLVRELMTELRIDQGGRS